MANRVLGWKPDRPDERDHIFSLPESAGEGAVALPSKVDLRQYCSPIDDQQDIGSCTAHAIVGAMEYLELKAGKKLVNLSRLFVYYNERVIENTVNEDAGAELRDGIKSVATLGACAESYCKYVTSRFTRKPSATAYKAGLRHLATAYQRIVSFDDMKACLAGGNPFVFGFTVYSSFMSDAVAATGKMPMPSHYEQEEGGHAVLAVGYDDDMQCMIVRNSWGTGWGDNGYFYMPYAYIKNPNLCSDMWVISK